jgi:hypothetical protein
VLVGVQEGQDPLEAYACDRAAADRFEVELSAREAALGSRTSRAWLDYSRGELRAERRDPDPARYLAAAVQAADDVDSGFVAGVARHTLLTLAVRDSDPAAALPASSRCSTTGTALVPGPRLWIAIRALVVALSRQQRHRDAADREGRRGRSSTSAFVHRRCRLLEHDPRCESALDDLQTTAGKVIAQE